MRQRRLSVLAVACVLSVLSVSSALTWADERFRGVYEASGTEEEATVQVSLSLRLFNTGSTDVTATVRILSRENETEAYAAFPLVFLAADGSARIDGDFTVPLSEYRQWQVGSPPVSGPEVELEYRNAADETVKVKAWVAPGPVSEEGED